MAVSGFLKHLYIPSESFPDILKSITTFTELTSIMGLLACDVAAIDEVCEVPMLPSSSTVNAYCLASRPSTPVTSFPKTALVQTRASGTFSTTTEPRYRRPSGPMGGARKCT